MLYNKFKTMFLVGEGDSVLSQVLNKSLAEQKQHEEANKTKEQWKKGSNKKSEKDKEQTGLYNSLKMYMFIVPTVIHTIIYMSV